MSLEPYFKSHNTSPIPYFINSGSYDVADGNIHLVWNKTSDTFAPWSPFLVASMSGYKNPRWKSQIRSGESATTDCSGIDFTANQGFHRWGINDYVFKVSNPSEYWHIKYDLGARFGSPLTAVVPVPPDTVTRVTNRVIQKFLDKCSEARSAVEAGQDFGEYKETLESIHRPLHSLRGKLESYFSSLEKVKKRYKTPPSLRKALADTYLEFHFGWLPLVDDVAAAIVKCGSIRPPQVAVSASASEDFAGSVSQLPLTVTEHSGDARPAIGVSDHSTYRMRYKGMIRTGSDSNGRCSTVQELQLLPRNWLPTAWDLLPYSWVADYFTNIGEMIESLCFIYGDLVWAQKTVGNVRTYKYSNIFHNDGYYWSLSSGLVRKSFTMYNYPATTTFTRHEWTRSVLLPDDLFARFQFRIPHGKYPYYNLGAILLSRARKLVPFF